jgi:drug/metabolite transporter (DMT)-like permease
VVQPWWSFPWDVLGADLGNVALGLAVVLVGTLLPFGLMVSALRHIPAARAAIVATLEPVLGAAFEWFIRGTKIDGVQILGGFAVVLAVIWVQSQSPDLQQESAPALREAR